METFSALLTLCEFPSQRPVTRSFDVFFGLRLNKRWVNNRDAGDLRRHGAHYDVMVITWKRVTKTLYPKCHDRSVDLASIYRDICQWHLQRTGVLILKCDWTTVQHRGEAMYISIIDFHIYIAHKEIVSNRLVIHNLIMITGTSYEITFTISLPKLINIAPL